MSQASKQVSKFFRISHSRGSSSTSRSHRVSGKSWANTHFERSPSTDRTRRWGCTWSQWAWTSTSEHQRPQCLCSTSHSRQLTTLSRWWRERFFQVSVSRKLWLPLFVCKERTYSRYGYHQGHPQRNAFHQTSEIRSDWPGPTCQKGSCSSDSSHSTCSHSGRCLPGTFESSVWAVSGGSCSLGFRGFAVRCIAWRTFWRLGPSPSFQIQR